MTAIVLTDDPIVFELKPHKFVKRPVEIEAIRWMGHNIQEILAFTGEQSAYWDAIDRKLHIHTLEGTMSAPPGSWIIKGVWGEYYPCANGVFLETYDEVHCA